MMKKIFTAADIETAKNAAAEEFGVPVEKISFNVLKEAKKSLFGKIKEEAEVEAVYECSKGELAANYIKNVFEKMGCTDIEIEVSNIENGAHLEIKGEGVESCIGRHGEVLDSLQYLASLVCNKIDREYFRISTDINGFRAKRKTQLESLAKRLAEKAKRTGRSVALEPMNPYERRIIHSVVSEIEGVTSHSKGEEPYRKVIISSTEKRPHSGSRKPGGRRRSDRQPKGYDIVSSFEKEYKKPKPEDSLGSGLYTKIDL